MPPPTANTEKEQMAALIESLTHLYGPDLRSGELTPLSLSRFLQEVIDKFALNGCFLVILKGTEIEVLAKHGIASSETQAVVEQIVNTVIDPCRQSPSIAAGNAEPLPVPAPSTLVIGDLFYAVNMFRLADDQWLLFAFATTKECDNHQWAMLNLIAVHLCGTVTHTRMCNDVSAAKDNLDRMTRELREMQVCSLNILEDLQRKNRDLRMLNEISHELASWRNLQELTKNAANAASGILDGAAVIVYVRDEAGKCFRPYQSSDNHDTGDPDSLTVEQSEPLFEEVKSGKKVQFDTSQEELAGQLARRVGCKTCLVIPLLSKDVIQGFILVCEKRWHRVYTEEEIENLRVLASTLAIAMENTDLLARTAQQVDEMSILKEYVETVLDSVDLGVMVVDTALMITVLSKGFERLYGYMKEDFEGKHLFEAFPHLVEQGFTEVAQQVLKGKPFVRHGWRRKNLDGASVVQNFRVFPHRSSSGEIIGAIAIVEDVTEKANLEEQLARSEAKFRRLVEDLDDGYLIITDGKIVYANRAVTQMSGTPVHELIGTEIANILEDDNLAARCQSSVADRFRCESRIIHSTGTWVPVEVTLSGCEYGGEQALSMLIRDITETRKFEKELEDKNREMRLRNEQITRLNLELEATINKLKISQESLIKSERIAAITQTSIATNHEINNPLFAVLGQAQLLLRKYKGKDEDTLRRLRAIEESALRIACVTKKLANLADPVVKEYSGLAATMIDVDRSTSK